jgi:beta-lactamase class A
MQVRYYQLGLLVLVCLLVGGAAGWLLNQTTPAKYKGGVLYQSNAPYNYIDPLLACDVGTQEAFPEFNSLKSSLTNVVQKATSSGDAESVSVYVRSLRSARWIEINPDTTYAPASLLKVFVMMAYYKEADDTDNPDALNKRVVFESSPETQNEDPGTPIPHMVAGKSYTIEQVIEQMIKYSDNDALNTLVDNFSPKTEEAFAKIFSDLSLPSPLTQEEGSLNFMAVHNYAMVFRVLYGSTYLSNRYSEQALDLLAQAAYKDGIVAGVPNTLVVAHKFGVTTIPATATSTATKELHDCGITYYPNNHPYLLCVMTKGQDFARLQQTIQTISKTTYAWLDNYYRNLPSATASTTSTVRP